MEYIEYIETVNGSFSFKMPFLNIHKEEMKDILDERKDKIKDIFLTS